MSVPLPHKATAAVPTTSGSRYLQQLCKHWSHKFAATFDEAQGTVPFDNGAVARLAAHTDTLDVTVEAADPQALERMKGVVASHLDRFAFREAPLTFDWRAG